MKERARKTYGSKAPRGPFLHVEIDDEEQEAYRKAAEERGKTVSVWVRETLRRAAGMKS